MTSEVRQALDPVADTIIDLDIESWVSGSVASSALGVARSTLDVDLVADVRPHHVEPVVVRLAPQYYVDAEYILEAIRGRRSFNLIHLTR